LVEQGAIGGGGGTEAAAGGHEGVLGGAQGLVVVGEVLVERAGQGGGEGAVGGFRARGGAGPGGSGEENSRFLSITVTKSSDGVSRGRPVIRSRRALV
jgi:hypothetical protein